MDPWTLAYLAGHRDMAITRRYVHPQDETIRAAMEKTREHKAGHPPVAPNMNNAGEQPLAVNLM